MKNDRSDFWRATTRGDPACSPTMEIFTVALALLTMVFVSAITSGVVTAMAQDKADPAVPIDPVAASCPPCPVCPTQPSSLSPEQKDAVQKALEAIQEVNDKPPLDEKK